MISKKRALDLTELLAVGTITICGYLIGGTLGASFMTNLGINLASTIVGSGSAKLKSKWLESEDGILNHDIQRALLRAYLKSLSNIKNCYFQENNKLSENEKKQINQLIKSLTESATSTFIPDIQKSIQIEEIKDYLYGDQTQGEELLQKRISSTNSLDDYDEKFRNYFLSKILNEIKFWFGEELKIDNHKGTKTWRAFQRLLLESIKDELTTIKSNQEEARKNLSKLPEIEKDIAKLVNVIEKEENSVIESKKRLDNDTDLTLSDELKEKIRRAKAANRKGNYGLSSKIWKSISIAALKENNKKLSIRAKLEMAVADVENGNYDLEDSLKIANECLEESKGVDLGNQKGKIIQILGEFHRIIRNIDQARGFQNAALEYAKENGDLASEGWIYLSMSMLSELNKEPIEEQLKLIQQAYDSFTNLQVSSEDKDTEEETISGYAACHMTRASHYGYNQFDNAISEYSKAIKLFKQLGKAWEFDLGEAYFERGEMQTYGDDYEHGIQDLINAEEIFNKLRNHYMAAKCIMACAELLDRKGARKESEGYFKSALLKASLIKEEKKKGWFYYRYATKLIELGDYKNSIQLLSWLVKSKSTTQLQKLDVLKTISNLLRVTNNEKELIEFEEYSLKIIDDLIYNTTDTKEKLRLIIDKAQSLEGLKKYDLALDTIERAFKLAGSLQNKDSLVSCWLLKARIYGLTENLEEERAAYDQIIQIIDNNEDSPYYITTLVMLAQIELKELNFDRTRELLDKAEKLCKSIPAMLIPVFDIKKRLEEAEGNQNKKDN